jgi:pimeloyl-ACP methyl ester carboxylesterase
VTVVSRLPGLVLTDHEFAVPLDHARPDGERITVYAREVVSPGRESADLPWLLFLQGGPGGKSPRPTQHTDWLGRAQQDYRVLLLDQRGTGRSTPVTRQTSARLGGAAEQAAYLKHFRADAIVADAEHIRRELIGDEPWSVLGQSYGGFCATTYLSFHPEGLREVLITGGVPSLEASADDIYRATYRRVLDRNRRYYERYPGDVEPARAVADHLAERAVQLPNGDTLTVPMFQQMGMAFGFSEGFERLHYLLEEAFVDGELSDTFRYGVEAADAFATNPLYAVLHEAAYAQREATRWSAERIRVEHPALDAGNGDRVLFTGEMIYPWMFEADSALRPLQRAASLLAEADDWPPLYDADRLRGNSVPVAAAVYYDDMYVEREFSEQTLGTVGNARGWITSEYDHDGLRVAGAVILGRLIEMARGER